MHSSPSLNASSASSRAAPFDVCVHGLGRIPYAEAYVMQRRLHQEVFAARRDQGGGGSGAVHVMLLEHDPPVITISRRPGARQHLLASDDRLRAAGIEIAETDRGGDITYHGPGQLVAYVILDLNRFGFRIDSYMRFLEQVTIDTLAQFGLEGTRDSAATGVWIAPHPEDAHGLQSVRVDQQSFPLSKICALGVRVSRWVSMHGLALNVTTNLAHFGLIVPCGLAGRRVTSMQRELGPACPAMKAVKDELGEQIRRALSARVSDVRSGDLA